MKETLNKIQQLPTEIRTAFSHGFVFLIKPNLIQHFPAREWSDAQILEELYARYQERGTFKLAGEYRIVELPNHPELLIIVP